MAAGRGHPVGQTATVSREPTMTNRLALAALLSASLLTPSVADACSRAVYFGLEGQTVTGRTLESITDNFGAY